MFHLRKDNPRRNRWIRRIRQIVFPVRVPPAVAAALRPVIEDVRHEEQIARDSGSRLRGRGLRMLFLRPPGTGKTMAAEFIANELRLDLYRVDLSAVVSKYIGETEKNLAEVFDRAEAMGAVLFFDEADALFGGRSDEQDAHDRYANLEISYLLQRIELYRGLVILAANQGTHMDPAFVRRFARVVNLPEAGSGERRSMPRK